MKKNERPLVEVHPGDIVTYNPRENLRTYGIVCNVRPDGLVYIVPITNAKCQEHEMIYLPFKKRENMKYFRSSVEEGTVLLAVGRMVFQKTVVSVVGVCKDDFFRNVLKFIPMAVNFTGDLINYVKRAQNAEEKWPDPDDLYYDSPPVDDPYIPLKIEKDGTVSKVGEGVS